MNLTKSEQEVIDAIREVKRNGFGTVTVKIKDNHIVHSEKAITKNY